MALPPYTFYIRMRNSQKPAGLRPTAQRYAIIGITAAFATIFMYRGRAPFATTRRANGRPPRRECRIFFILPPARARTNTLRLMAKRRIEGQTAAGFSHSYIEAVGRPDLPYCTKPCRPPESGRAEGWSLPSFRPCPSRRRVQTHSPSSYLARPPTLAAQRQQVPARSGGSSQTTTTR